MCNKESPAPPQGSGDYADTFGALYREIAAVKEAATRANTQVTNAEVAWSPGDWRVQKVREYAAGLSSALDTLRQAAAAHRAPPVSDGKGDGAGFVALEQLVAAIVRDVTELPDRTSPEYNGDMMLVTAEELASIIRQQFIDANGDLAAAPLSPREGVSRAEVARAVCAGKCACVSDRRMAPCVSCWHSADAVLSLLHPSSADASRGG